MAKRIPESWPAVVAVAAALGVATWACGPEALPQIPDAAAELYGNTPSRHSAAPGGVLTFAGWLSARGYQVDSHASAVPPTTEVLFLLAPKFAPDPRESEALLGWVQRGGQLIYAPQVISFTAPTAAFESLLAPASQELVLDETLGPLLRQAGRRFEATPDYQLLAIGRGHVATLCHGPKLLTNANLSTTDPAVTLAFLTPLLQGKRTVAFDEGRLGVEPPPGLWGVLRASRYRAMPWWLFGVAGLWWWATGVRRQPPQASAKRAPGSGAGRSLAIKVHPGMLAPSSLCVRGVVLVALAALVGILLGIAPMGGWLAGAVLGVGGVDAARLWVAPAPRAPDAEMHGVREAWLWANSPWRLWCRRYRYACDLEEKVSAT